MPNYAKPAASDSLKETRDKDSSLAAALKAAVLNQVPRKCAIPNYAKPAASDSLKETRDKDSSLAAALKTAVFNPMLSKTAILCQIMQSRPLPILSKRPEIRIPAWRQVSKRPFSTRCPEKALCYAKLCKASSLKETRDKDSSLAAALKAVVFAKPAASDSLKPGGSSQNGGFQPDALKRSNFMSNYAKPAASDSPKETRDKDSSLAAALKAAVLNQVPRKCAILCQIMQSRPLPILSKRPEIRIPAWRQL